MCTEAICYRFMVAVGKGNFFHCSHIAVDAGCMWRQELSLQLVLQQHVVLRRKAETRSEEDKGGDGCHQMILHTLEFYALCSQ